MLYKKKIIKKVFIKKVHLKKMPNKKKFYKKSQIKKSMIKNSVIKKITDPRGGGTSLLQLGPGPGGVSLEKTETLQVDVQQASPFF